MPDYGSLVADKAIASVQRQIHSVYTQAAKDVKAKLSEFTSKHLAKDKLMREKLEKGLITQDQYASWMRGQLFMEKQWKDKLDQCNKIMLHANEEAARIVQGKRLDVFAENYNHQAFELEKKIGGSVGFNTYNAESVERLLTKNPSILPKYKVNQKKDYVWNGKKARNSVTQGIIQGESIDEITKRLTSDLCTLNENKMRTFARTSVTGAQNAGRLEQMHDAEEMGIKVKKRWLATLDSRTRDTHQELDGQEVAVDEPFVVDGMEIMFPGDPNAEPELVYNCRCTLIQVYEGIERTSVRRDDEGNLVENMTYQEWKEWKEGEKGFTGTESPDNIDNENGSVNNTERIAQDKDELGSDEDKLRSMMNYSSLDEESVTDAAEALFGFGSDPNHCYFDGADSEIRSRATPEASKRADAIQKYIDASPKAEGTIYRGMAIPQEMLDSLQPGTEFNENKYAVSSWSTSENVGQRYASNSKNKYGGERVVFEYSNPMHGTPVAHLSPVPIEQEVLVNNKEVKYRIVSRKEYTKSSNANGERKFTRIILEEIED